MADNARKQRVNLTISEDVMASARQLGLNASLAAEEGLRRAVADKLAETWREENRVAIEAHNQRVEAKSVLLPPSWLDE